MCKHHQHLRLETDQIQIKYLEVRRFPQQFDSDLRTNVTTRPSPGPSPSPVNTQTFAFSPPNSNISLNAKSENLSFWQVLYICIVGLLLLWRLPLLLLMVTPHPPPQPSYQCPPLHWLEYQPCALYYTRKGRSLSKIKSENKLLNLKITSQVMRNIQFSCLRIIRETQTHHLERVIMIAGGREEGTQWNRINSKNIILLGPTGGWGLYITVLAEIWWLTLSISTNSAWLWSWLEKVL